MLLSELLYYCQRDLQIACNSLYLDKHRIAAEQLGELSALIQNELRYATTPGGAFAIPAAERPATTTHLGDGKTDSPVEQPEEKTETKNASDVTGDNARQIRNQS